LVSQDVHHRLYLDGYEIETTARPENDGSLQFVADRSGCFTFRCSMTCGPHPYRAGYLKAQQDYRPLSSIWLVGGLLGMVLVSLSRSVKAAAPVSLPEPVGEDKTMKRKFADLEAYEALHVAIFIEERNARIYERFAQQFAESSDEESQAIAATFREMADEELGHGSRLQELYYQYFKNQPCSLTDADIEEVIEVPQLQGAEPFISGAPNRRWALEAALTAERQAKHFYTDLALLTMEAPLRGLYQELARQERDHEEFLERKLAATETG